MAFFNITLLGPQEPFKVAVRKPAAEDKLTTESPTAASLSGPSQVSPGPSQTPPAQGPSLTPPGSSKTSPRQARWSREPIPSPLSSRSSPRPGQTSPQLSHTLPGPIQALPRPSTTIPGLLSYVGGQASPTGGQASPTGAAQGMLSPTGAAQGMLSPTGAVYPEGTHLVTVSKEKEGQQPQSPAKPHERVMEPSSTATAKEDELPPLHPSLIATAPFAEPHHGSHFKHGVEHHKHRRCPQGPNQLYKYTLTSAQEHGRWLLDGQQTWTRQHRHTHANSEMTRFVDEMHRTNKEFQLF